MGGEGEGRFLRETLSQALLRNMSSAACCKMNNESRGNSLCLSLFLYSKVEDSWSD